MFKAEFFLPENASNYLNILADPFDLTTRPITGRRRRRRSIEEIEAPTEKPKNAVDEYHGYDVEQNEKYERHQVEAEIVESGTEPSDDDDDNNQMSDEELWFQDDHYDKSNDPMALKHPQNLATSRWTVYKGIAALAERFAFNSFV